MKFKVIGEDGQEIECELLFSFESDETKKSYVVYTDNTYDEEGNIKVYAAITDPNEETINLKPIETEREWKIVETILEEVQAEFEKKESESGQ
ncbi:MAG: DUF1292 domain-containing protein [Bacilli bacterium]|nr:DUF1292 domain-containing protein [Bacilli bacterium]